MTRVKYMGLPPLAQQVTGMGPRPAIGLRDHFGRSPTICGNRQKFAVLKKCGRPIPRLAAAKKEKKVGETLRPPRVPMHRRGPQPPPPSGYAQAASAGDALLSFRHSCRHEHAQSGNRSVPCAVVIAVGHTSLCLTASQVQSQSQTQCVSGPQYVPVSRSALVPSRARTWSAALNAPLRRESEGVARRTAGILTPVLRPAALGEWRITTIKWRRGCSTGGAGLHKVLVGGYALPPVSSAFAFCLNCFCRWAVGQSRRCAPLLTIAASLPP